LAILKKTKASDANVGGLLSISSIVDRNFYLSCH